MLVVVCTLLVSVGAFAQDCFDRSFVRTWSYDSDTRILTVDSLGKTYEVTTWEDCHELAWAGSIGFSSFMGSHVCKNDKVGAFDGFGRLTQVCRIDTVTKVEKVEE